MTPFIKLFVLAGSILFFLNCNHNDTPIIRKYGITLELDERKAVLVDLSNFDSYDDLAFRVEEVACHEGVPTIALMDGATLMELGLANPCWADVGCIKQKNVLKIKDNSILVKGVHTLDSLDYFVSKHYNNNGQSPYFSEHPLKAIISITYDQRPIYDLGAFLLRVVKAYDKANTDAPLIVMLDKNRKPPPPPPPSLN